MRPHLASGILAALAGVAALFFLRFWIVQRERLFLYFSCAFTVLAIDWLRPAVLDVPPQTAHYFYILRLVAFAFILGGILDKNSRR